MQRWLAVVAVCVLAALVGGVPRLARGAAPAAGPRSVETYGRLPLSFDANAGRGTEKSQVLVGLRRQGHDSDHGDGGPDGDDMHEVTYLAIISNGFWLILLLVVMFLFRRELKAILGSLGAFKVMGASFQMRDRKATLESYAILADILVEVLSQRDTAEKFYPVLSSYSAGRLATFAKRYADEVPAGDRNIELVKNVAFLSGRRGNYQSAISIYDELLKQVPEDSDVLYLKARALRESGIKENLTAAEGIYEKLLQRYPSRGHYWNARARTEARLRKFSESLDSLNRAIDLGYEGTNEDFLESNELQLLRDAKPDEFKALRQRRAELRSGGKPGIMG
jgi:Flp pilus assembly protein TadD